MSSNGAMPAPQASEPTAPPPALPAPPGTPMSPLAIRDFRVYWLGQAVSLVGMWTQMVAQGWILTEVMHVSTATFGWMSVVGSIPMMLLSMPGGVVADRFDRRKILIISQLLFAALAFTYAALVYSDQLTLVHMFTLAAIAGVIMSFDFPAQQALVPQLVPPALIPKAVGLNQAVFHGSRFLGPAIAGLLMTYLSTGAAFVANGLSYFAVIYSLVIIRSLAKPGGAPVPDGAAASKGKGGMAEGLAYVRTEPVLMALIGLTGLITTFVMPIFAVFMPMFATKMFHATKGEFGMVMAASGLGAVIGSLSMMRVPAAVRGRMIVVGAAVATCGIVALSYMESPYTASAIIVVLNSATALTLGLSATTIQVMVPNALRGRVMGIYMLTFTTLMPPFALLWGYVADATSLHTLMLMLGLGFGATALTLLSATRIWSMQPGAAPPPRSAHA